MSDLQFHPAVTTWFEKRFTTPTVPQQRAWPSIQAGRHTLIAAPTGSGKTLAAFLAALDDLVRQGCAGTLEDATQVVYVSPLKALSNDIRINLQEPLAGIREELERRGEPDVDIRVMVRTGDTPQSERQAMVRRPPHLIVTTPESLYLLLTSDSGRRMLSTVHTVIVDEIHALAHDKRGSHLSLSLERLDALTEHPLTRIGLSATQKPIDLVARFLVGAPDGAGTLPECTLVDTGHVRQLDLDLVLPESPLEAVMSNEVWEEVHAHLAAEVERHRTTLVFVNTRRLAERLARQLSDRLGEGTVTSHHGSLSREHRLEAEQRLKAGSLRALVATASLELGIDIGDVDLVCQIGSTRSIAAFLQRVGRSGHGVDRIPKGRLFPLSRDELVECVALLRSVRERELDTLSIPQQPLDILAQQIVAAVACEEWQEDALFDRVRRAWPYRELRRETFEQVLEMLADGYSTRRGRRSAYLQRDLVQKRLRARRGARLAAITSGGAIPDTADYRVVLEPGETFVGTVNEDFAIESLPGDVFQLGNASWRIRRIEAGRVRVEDAKGQPPNMPFWLGEAPGRSDELSAAVSRLREEVGELLLAADEVGSGSQSASVDGVAPDAAADRVGEARRHQASVSLQRQHGISEAAASQVIDYLDAARSALGSVPTQQHIVIERFFDEAGGMQLVVHAPFGSRLNRAWGLALRKRFCRSFNFELQAAATEDAIVLSLGATHSFPLEDVARFLDASTVRPLLVQALLDAPMFTVRWRWNAGRALAIPRFSGGRRVAPQIARMQAEDLLSVVFPDQLACLENIAGDREIPDHPLVTQTIVDCLDEAMDIDRLETLLRDLKQGNVTFAARDVREPSPLSMEILNARPYAFLDDAPLEERRTQAVLNRRWLDPDAASDIGALDAAAIARVREECWPQVDNADELQDALVLLGFLTAAEGTRAGWGEWFDILRQQRRATQGTLDSGHVVWVAVDRLTAWQALHADLQCAPTLEIPEALRTTWDADAARRELVRGRLEGLGPVTAATLAASLDVHLDAATASLLQLESEGFVLRGRFTPGTTQEEWCERRLLARVHRYTLKRLRSEIEPVSAQDYMRFLLDWQHVSPQTRVQGPGGVAAVLEQLEGLSTAAAAWEGHLLPARVSGYDPAWLDQLCLSGKVVWARSGSPARVVRVAATEEEPRIPPRRAATPIRTTPIALFQRPHLGFWPVGDEPTTEDTWSAQAQTVLERIRSQGASFFGDLVRSTGLLPTQVETALAELVAHGCVTADGFTGLRALLVPSDKRRPLRPRPGSRARAQFGIEDAGRWVALAPPGTDATDPEERLDFLARLLLRRYGVVFKRVLERESVPLPWRDLLRTYRRLEARGEIRGGRFVSGFTGEQYALPEAVGALRAVRREPRTGILVSLSAADPLNQVGILSPGERIPAHADNRILYEDGVVIASRVAGDVRLLTTLDAAREWQVRQALVQQQVSPSLRSYLKHAG